MLSALELRRQLLHLLVGSFLIVLLYFNILSALSLLLLIIIGIILSFLSKQMDLPFIYFFLRYFEREEQKNSFPGKGFIMMVIGTLLAIKLFPQDIALASIIILTLGDSLSHIVGAKLGKLKNIFNRNSPKLLEGTIIGTLAGTLGALFFVSFPEAFLGSLTAMVAELVKIDFNGNTLDDNIIIPLVAGTAMVLVRKYLLL